MKKGTKEIGIFLKKRGKEGKVPIRSFYHIQDTHMQVATALFSVKLVNYVVGGAVSYYTSKEAAGATIT